MDNRELTEISSMSSSTEDKGVALFLAVYKSISSCSNTSFLEVKLLSASTHCLYEERKQKSNRWSTHKYIWNILKAINKSWWFFSSSMKHSLS